MALPELYTVDDVIRRFNWSRGKLYKLIRAGLFPDGRNVGGKKVWTCEDLAAYLLLAGRWKPEGAAAEGEDDDRD